MQISKIQGSKNQSFEKLYIAQKLAEKVTDNTTSAKFLSNFDIIKNYITTNKLDKKKFVDIILSENNDTFYATISSKGQGIPYNPNGRVAIEKIPTGITKDNLVQLKKWVNNWNKAYNPKKLNELKKIDELVKNANWENTPLEKSIKALYE